MSSSQAAPGPLLLMRRWAAHPAALPNAGAHTPSFLCSMRAGQVQQYASSVCTDLALSEQWYTQICRHTLSHLLEASEVSRQRWQAGRQGQAGKGRHACMQAQARPLPMQGVRRTGNGFEQCLRAIGEHAPLHTRAYVCRRARSCTRACMQDLSKAPVLPPLASVVRRQPSLPYIGQPDPGVCVCVLHRVLRE